MTKTKTLTLNFRLGKSSPRPFGELNLYQAFVFEHHKNMVNPHIQIKIGDQKAALLCDLVMPPFPTFNGIYPVDNDPLCYPLS